jgi:hypothetical protein
MGKSLAKTATCFFLLFFLFTLGGSRGVKDQVSGEERRLELRVEGNVDWTDTGLDVTEGQVVYFRAKGQIRLQLGNPVTYCRPDGYNYQSVQQPLQDKNIGALIGKVYLLISVETDEETGEEIRNELSETFYIGSANRVTVPMNGRLFLGINENLVADNDGFFTVVIFTEYPEEGKI